MKYHVGVIVVLTLLGAGLASATDYEIERWDLEEGTEVILVEDHRTPLVNVVIEIPVGHWSPWAREQHAEEAFEIQDYDPDGTLRARADQLSADLGVRMGAYASTVSASCLREDLKSVLRLIGDVLTNRDFDKHELKRWNKSAKLAWKGSQKEPEFRLGQVGARLLYEADDPRRRGYEEPRRMITDGNRLAEARDVVARVPGRVIAFAGDLTRDDAERFASGLLPPVAESPPEGLEPVLGPVTAMEDISREHVETMPRIKQTFFGYGRHSLTYDDPSYPAFIVADHVLAGHFFSRMYKALRHEGGETYSAGTEGSGGVYREGYALVTYTRAENAEATEDKLREVLRVFHEGGITEEERQAAVGFLLGRRPFGRQSPAQILGRCLWERRHGLPTDFYDDLIDRTARVPLDEINAFIREFYDPAGFAMLKVSPK
jgi:predicted Zn-dependent peptidase